MAYSAQITRLQRRLEAIPESVREAVKPALAKSADELADAMKSLAPEDTGALKDSIAITLPGETTPAYSQPGGSRVAADNEVIVTVGNHAVRYAHLVEYGTVHAHAQPFFWPAFRILKKRIESRIKRSISKAVKDGLAK
jgi:HK97 gp10 family phage protein